MKLTTEQLEGIENNAELQYSTEEVALIVEIDEELLQEGAGLKAYLKGRYRADAIVRRANYKMAQQGSTQAIKIMMQQAENSKVEFEKEENYENKESN